MGGIRQIHYDGIVFIAAGQQADDTVKGIVENRFHPGIGKGVAVEAEQCCPEIFRYVSPGFFE